MSGFFVVESIASLLDGGTHSERATLDIHHLELHATYGVFCHAFIWLIVAEQDVVDDSDINRSNVAVTILITTDYIWKEACLSFQLK